MVFQGDSLQQRRFNGIMPKDMSLAPVRRQKYYLERTFLCLQIVNMPSRYRM